MSIKLENAVIDIFKVNDIETLIIRGVISSESLPVIKVDKYQREILSGTKRSALIKALKTSTVPDIELGMRGERYITKSEGASTNFFLQNDTYVIDGLQRISAAIQLIKNESDQKPRLGAVVHVNTTEEWERNRFRILNQEQTKLNTNVILRNLCSENKSLEMINRLCSDETFVLHNRVQWTQRMNRGEILSALVLVQTIGYLHSQFGPGRGGKGDEIGAQLDKTMETVGRNTMRENVKTFFELIDDCWGIKRIAYASGAAYIKRSFLLVMADLFTHHQNFWRGNRLFIERDLRAKIAKFPIQDPQVVNLCSSGGKSKDILYQLVLEHVNSGKRTRRLKLNPGVEIEVDTDNQKDTLGLAHSEQAS